MHSTNDIHARAAVTRGLSLAGLLINQDRIATMVERVVTMLQTVGHYRGAIFRRFGVDAPNDVAIIDAAVKQLVDEVRHGDVDLSGAHVSPGIILPGHVDCTDCGGMGVVCVDALGKGQVFTTCDCADPRAMMGDDSDGWEMPAWQVATSGSRATMMELDDVCESTQRVPEVVAPVAAA